MSARRTRPGRDSGLCFLSATEKEEERQPDADDGKASCGGHHAETVRGRADHGLQRPCLRRPAIPAGKGAGRDRSGQPAEKAERNGGLNISHADLLRFRKGNLLLNRGGNGAGMGRPDDGVRSLDGFC